MSMNPIPLIIGAMALILLRARSGSGSGSGSDATPDLEAGSSGGTGPQTGTQPSHNISRTTDPVKASFEIYDPGGTQQAPPTQKALPSQQTLPPQQTPASSDVPSSSYCADVADWPDEWREKEQAILDQLNALRTAGLQCATGNLQPVAPLTMNPKLRCSARKHSKDMATSGFFSHVNLQGKEHWDRMRDAGYDWLYSSENIASGRDTASGTMDQWVQSTAGHCEALLNPNYTEIGIGYYPGGATGHYWTQNFGQEK